MEVYVAVIQKSDIEVEFPDIEIVFNVGVYSTKEKAEEKILSTLRELDCSNAPLLSLETYQAQKDPYYDFWVETYTLDK